MSKAAATMSKFWRPHLELNVAACVGEAIGTGFLMVAGIGVLAPAFATVMGAGAGLGLALFVLTFCLWMRSGAHFNPGVTLAKGVAWATGMSYRDYFGRPALLWDGLFVLLYIGFQLAGAVIGALVLRYVDKSGILSLPINTAPNGNLAGDEGRALFFAFVCNFFFIWVHLIALGPRHGAVIKMLGSPLVIGIAYAGAVILSVYWGTGTTCNFALDLALATILPGTTVKFLWISIVAQILGGLAALLVFLGNTWCDFRMQFLMQHGAKNMDHGRENSLRDLFLFAAVHGEHAMDDAAHTEPLVDPHDVAPAQAAQAHVMHRQRSHHHHIQTPTEPIFGF